MDAQQFVKYTSCGNNFVILDQLNSRTLSEEELSRFGYQATNPSFGVGADNLLVVQRCDENTLREINETFSYWQELPEPDTAEIIFRMFEPNGEEALCCGNGLMSIAHYLHRTYDRTTARVLTEVPFHKPNVVVIGTDEVHGQSWVNLGEPRRTPESIFTPKQQNLVSPQIDQVDDLHIHFRKHDLEPFTDKTVVDLNGYLVFTGEPHLVLFPEQHDSLRELMSSLFITSNQEHPDAPPVEKRVNFGTWFLRRIGYALNQKCRGTFPAGVNVNVARLLPEQDAVEYRCFERGIEHETLACGTGALAVAYVSKNLGLLSGRQFNVHPHRCRWQEPTSSITVSSGTDGWVLSTSPRELFQGTFVDQMRPFQEDLQHGTFNYEQLALAEMDG